MVVLSSLKDPQLIDLLRAGKVGVMPTDTIYGLCASAADRSAVERLHAVKRWDQRLDSVVAASLEQLSALGLDEPSLRVAAVYWPNPLSIRVPADDHLAYLHTGLKSLLVRIPADEPLRQLLSTVGPIVTASANRPNETPAATLQEAQRYFGETVDFYVEGGDRTRAVPSTVARLDNGVLTVLRPGAVNIDEEGRIIA